MTLDSGGGLKSREELQTEELNNIVHADPTDDLATKAADADGGILVLEPGTFSGDLSLSDMDIIIKGAGKEQTVLTGEITATHGSRFDGHGVRLRDLSLDGQDNAAGSVGFALADQSRTVPLQNVKIERYEIGYRASDTILNDHYGVFIRNNDIGYKADSTITAGSFSGNVTTNHFFGGEFQAQNTRDLYLRGNVARCRWVATTIEGVGGTEMIELESVSGEGNPNRHEWVHCGYEPSSGTAPDVFSTSGDGAVDSLEGKVIGCTFQGDTDFLLGDFNDAADWQVKNNLVRSSTITVDLSGETRRMQVIGNKSGQGGTFAMSTAGAGHIIKDNDDHVTVNGGETTVDDGGTIAHGVASAPNRYNVEAKAAGVMAHVTAVDGTNLTVEVLNVSDGSTAGTGNSVVWSADASRAL